MYNRIIPENTPEQNCFTSISDFKWCMKCGGEGVAECVEIDIRNSGGF